MSLRVPSLTWPKLIGVVVALLSIGCLLSTFGEFLRLGLFTRPPDLIGPVAWFTLVAGLSLFILSFPLYHGRDWARRVLFIMFCVVFIALAVSGISQSRRQWSVPLGGSFTSEETADLRRGDRIYMMIGAGVTLSILAAQGLLTCLLIHPDVANAFQSCSRPTGRANI